jgi:hypothetical protein
MEASIYNQDVDRFENKISEGKVYSFFGVRVGSAPSEYKLADQPYECLLTKDTIIKEEDDDHGIPTNSFQFTTFDMTHTFAGKHNLLIGKCFINGTTNFICII